jgi:carboxyl-terminal processing protease
MKRLCSIVLALCLLLGVAPVHADLQTKPFAEVGEVYRNVLENHLSRPEARQLVQGALQHISQQAAEQTLQLSVPADDDTLPELEKRLTEWQSRYNLDGKTLNRWAINGMLGTLKDPHTAFFTKEELNRFQAGVENEFVGFGFRLRMQGGTLMIRELIPQSPAAASDLQKGDQLLAVDGLSLKGKSFEEAYALLKGEEGSEAVLTVYRPSQKREKQIRLKRAFLSIPEVEGDRFAGSNIGYIHLETFGSDAAYQLRDKLTEFSQAGKPLRGLLLDLRDNGGGYLTAARDIAGLFMEEGLLMITTNRNGVELETWVRNGRDITYPVRILVNEGTASASELLAGALRDHGIAKLIGTKTYGKGSAQQVIPLLDGDALKITLQEYFTPKHTTVNHVGLTPDLTVEEHLSQVVEGLRSLGVNSFELREGNGDTFVNGVAFPVIEPLFKREQGGIAVRAAVLATLLRDKEIGNQGYVPLAPYLQKNKQLSILQENGDMVLRFQSP